MENDNDKLSQIIKKLNDIEKELSDRVARIEKHLGLEKATQTEQVSKPVQPSVPSVVKEIKDKAPLSVKAVPKDVSNIETKIGTKYLNWIGVIALVFGVGFFLKYAFDNNWIGPTGRVMIGIVLGLLLIIGGHYATTKKYKIPAWGLMGGGLAILYLSIFAAFGFYHLIEQVPAFGFMILVTITGITLSVRYNALPIAVLVLIGGFLTPILLSTHKDNQIALFSYIALLDIGIFVTAYFKKWRLLDYLAFIFTVLLFFGWYFQWYNDTKLFRTVFFLSVFFVIFAFLSFFCNIIHRKKTGPVDLILLLGTPAWYFGTAYGLMHVTYRGYMGLYDLVMVAIYMVLVRITQLRNKEDKYLILVLLGIGVTFLTLVIPIQLEHKWITIGWAVEASVLMWIAFQTRSLATRIGGLAILFLVIIRLVFIESSNINYEHFRIIFNERFLTFLIALLSFLVSTYLYFKHKDPAHPTEPKIVIPILVVFSTLLGFWMITMETIAYYDYSVVPYSSSGLQRALSVAWTLYALILIIIGILNKYSLVRWLSFPIFAITIIKVFLFDLSTLEPVYRITSFIVLGAILIGVSFLYQRFKKRLQ